METLTLNRKAHAFSTLTQQFASLTLEPGSTLARYLCLLAQHHPRQLTFADFGDELGITKPQVSRITRALHKLAPDGSPGLDLIDVFFDLHNPRLKLVSLNERGLAEMTRILGREE